MQSPPRSPFPVLLNRVHMNVQVPSSPINPETDRHITSQVDHYLETTYRGLITQQIDSLCKPEFAPTNSLLINYIRHIYTKYALQDPMKKYGDQRYWGSTDPRGSSLQKQTPPRGPAQQRQSRFAMTEGQPNHEPRIVQSRFLTPDKSLLSSRMTAANQGTAGRESLDRGQQRASLGLSAGSSQIEDSRQIDAVFRYCFECEKSVLQFNMLNHEKNCPGFMSLYQKSTQEIVQLLETKIQRIKLQVIAALNSKEESRLPNLKQATTSWLAAVELSQKTKVLTWEFQKEYARIRDCYKSPELMILELSYKLRWFMRIREEIKNKFGL